MIKKEMSENFNVTTRTLINWDKGSDKGRKLLYEVLKRLPNEFIKDVKKQLENEEKLKDSLKKDD